LTGALTAARGRNRRSIAAAGESPTASADTPASMVMEINFSIDVLCTVSSRRRPLAARHGFRAGRGLDKINKVENLLGSVNGIVRTIHQAGRNPRSCEQRLFFVNAATPWLTAGWRELIASGFPA